jgi:hypothetical protein
MKGRKHEKGNRCIENNEPEEQNETNRMYNNVKHRT